MATATWAGPPGSQGGAGDSSKKIQDGVYQIVSAPSSGYTQGNNQGFCHPDVVQRPFIVTGVNDKPDDYHPVGVSYLRMNLEVKAPDGSKQFWNIDRCNPTGINEPLTPMDSHVFVSSELGGAGLPIGFADGQNHAPSSTQCAKDEREIYPTSTFSENLMQHHEACMALQTLVHDHLVMGNQALNVEVKNGAIVVPNSL